MQLFFILLCVLALCMRHYGQPEEFRCGECTENPDCPAADTGVLYPCPYCLSELITLDAEIEVC